MHALDLFGLAAAVMIALLTQVITPKSRAWWAGMFLSSAVATAALVDIGWNNWPLAIPAKVLTPESGADLPFQSRYGRWLFTCQTAAIDFHRWVLNYRTRTLPDEEANGFLVSISEIQNGVHFEKEAITSKAKAIEGGGLAARGITKLVLDATNAGAAKVDIAVTFDLPANQRSALLVKPDLADRQMITAREELERMFGILAGRCRMI